MTKDATNQIIRYYVLSLNKPTVVSLSEFSQYTYEALDKSLHQIISTRMNQCNFLLIV